MLKKADRPLRLHRRVRAAADAGGVASGWTPWSTDMLLGTGSLDGFLDSLAHRALAQTSMADGCGVTVSREGRHLTVASAGRSARKLDEKQYSLDDGPCLQAMREAEEVLVTDMSTEQRWGTYPADAAAFGARSSLSLPIAVHTDTAGALNLYSPHADGFAGADLEPLRALAAQATGAIALMERIADAEEFVGHLQTALRSRAVIDQAIGIVMGQRQCDGGTAFAVLRDASQNRNVKLREVCAERVTTTGGGTPRNDGLRPRP